MILAIILLRCLNIFSFIKLGEWFLHASYLFENNFFMLFCGTKVRPKFETIGFNTHQPKCSHCLYCWDTILFWEFWNLSSVSLICFIVVSEFHLKICTFHYVLFSFVLHFRHCFFSMYPFLLSFTNSLFFNLLKLVKESFSRISFYIF